MTDQQPKPSYTPDVFASNEKQGTSWVYTDLVKEHFFNPRNLVMGEPPKDYSGVGMVGSPACGDAMKIWITVDPATDRIVECKWQTFGCASAIGSTSMMSVIVTKDGGMKIDDALKLRPQDIMEALGGLPVRKVHCSVLGDKALRSAVNDYFRRSGQTARMLDEGKKLVDKVLKIYDKDIEEAVLDGARTLEEVQHKTKAGTGDPGCIPEVEQLIRFYTEKYYG